MSTKKPLPVSAAAAAAASNAAPAATPAPAPAAVPEAAPAMRLPAANTLEHAVKLAIQEDRPILMDYWVGSIEKTVLIGQRDDETKQKILVRNTEEYTSPIEQILKVGNDYIIKTENSIYLVDVKIPFRRISS
jgi:hypothetical protein